MMVPFNIPVCERVMLVFGGWLQQFENPPDWLPEISIDGAGNLVLDGHVVCPADEILGIVSSVEEIFFDTDVCRYIVHIDWPFTGTPAVGAVVRVDWPSGCVEETFDSQSFSE